MSTQSRDVTDYIVTDLRATTQMNTIITSAFFFGILTVLALETVFFLVHNGITRTSTRIQLLSIATIYASTCLYFAISIPYYTNAFAWYIANLQGSPLSSTKWGEDTQRVQSLLETSTTLINIFVGDAIVWWRACAVWPGNFYVRAACAEILTATLATGIVTTYNSGTLGFGLDFDLRNRLTDSNGSWSACLFLSFAGNFTATCLIGYKSWVHRMFLKEALSRAAPTSRALRLLSLLVQSGAGYSLLWLTIVVFQLYFSSTNQFWSLTRIFGDGVLMYLVGAYPMLIIVLVNLDRRRGDPWEGYLSGSVHNASVRFADPRREDLTTARVRASLASVGVVDQGEQEGDRFGAHRRSAEAV